MASLSNTPSQPVTLTLAARKSFSFTVQFLGDNGRPLSLAGAIVTLAIGARTGDDLVLTRDADTVSADSAVALFNLQADDLDLVPGVYPFEIVTNVEGYSTVAISGELEIEASHERKSTTRSYATAPSTFGLIAHMKHNRLVVSTNSLVLRGEKGERGLAGESGNPFEEVAVTYNVDGRIASLTIAGTTTTYSYNGDGTIAFDERDGTARSYHYTDGKLTSIEPQIGS